MVKQCCSFVLLVATLLGCGGVEYPSISMEVAKEVKSGTPLEEIKKLLGDPHPPTSSQANYLADTVSKMPEPMRTNATKDKSLAWGNDSDFLVAKVNDQDVVWVTAWRSGSH